MSGQVVCTVSPHGFGNLYEPRRRANTPSGDWINGEMEEKGWWWSMSTCLTVCATCLRGALDCRVRKHPTNP
jgi:hypothetical protein